MTVIAGLSILALIAGMLWNAGLFLFRRDELGERQTKYGRRMLACFAIVICLLALLVLIG